MTATTLAASSTTCFHCGEPCRGDEAVAGGHSFCCAGCRAVYEILRASGLEGYYALEAAPGTPLRAGAGPEGRFAFLDDDSLRREWVEELGGGRCQVVLRLPQVHCASCVWLLERLDRLEEGVLDAQVDLLRREAVIDFDGGRTSLRRIVERLAAIGYEPELTLAAVERRQQGADPLIGRLAVAGFSFANIMLFSLPGYLAGAGGLGAAWSHFFAALSALLVLPVLFYSADVFWKSAWRHLRHGAASMDVPIALGLAALAGRTAYEMAAGRGSGYADSLAGLVFLLLLGRLFQRRTFKALAFDRDYRSYFPLAAQLVEGDGERSAPLASLRPGQRIRVRHGELVPADSRLLSRRAALDYSYITGEAEAVECAAGQVLRAGGRLLGEAADLEVLRPVSQSYLTRLWNRQALAGDAGEAAGLADAFSKYFTLAVVAVALLAALYWWRLDAGRAIDAFTAVLVVACPCALALASPFATGTALNALAAAGLYLRRAEVVEDMARVRAIAFDKTGTLTCAGGARFAGRALTGDEAARLAALLRHSAHPLSRRLCALLPPPAGAVSAYEERPGRGVRGAVDGCALVVGSRAWLAQNGVALPPAEAAEAAEVHVAVAGLYRGHFLLRHACRPGVAQMLGALGRRFALYLLSGDGARAGGELAPFFGRDHLCFGQSPEDKLDFVARLEEGGCRTLMVGDGLNDAGALKRSSVGLAVSEEASAFAPACDGILAADQLVALPRLLRFARGVRRLIGAGMGLSLLYNVAGLGFAVQGLLSPLLAAVLMPLSSLSTIAFSSGATRLWAHYLQLGRET